MGGRGVEVHILIADAAGIECLPRAVVQVEAEAGAESGFGDGNGNVAGVGHGDALIIGRDAIAGRDGIELDAGRADRNRRIDRDSVSGQRGCEIDRGAGASIGDREGERSAPRPRAPWLEVDIYGATASRTDALGAAIIPAADEVHCRARADIDPYPIQLADIEAQVAGVGQSNRLSPGTGDAHGRVREGGYGRAEHGLVLLRHANAGEAGGKAADGAVGISHREVDRSAARAGG